MLKRWSAVLIQQHFRGFSARKKGLPPLMDSKESEADGSPSLLDSKESKADESYVSSLSGTEYMQEKIIVKNLYRFHLQLQLQSLPSSLL